MKEIPILFSTEMVKALKDGRKTMTRRIVNPQPERCEMIAQDCASPSGYSAISDAYGEAHLKHRYGKAGDLLYVRESSAITYSTGPKMKRMVWYKADDPVIPERVSFKWKPSIHMPKSAARIWLRVTDIRVERLQDISEEDAKAEGVKPNTCDNPATCPSSLKGNGCCGDGQYLNYLDPSCEGEPCYSAVESWESLWKFINGPESWESNPFVWVIGFKILSITGHPGEQK